MLALLAKKCYLQIYMLLYVASISLTCGCSGTAVEWWVKINSFLLVGGEARTICLSCCSC